MNRDAFFREVRARPFGGKLDADQVSGMNLILDEWERRDLDDDRWLAYMLATAKWETAHTMQPIAERGGSAYFRKMYDVEGARPALAKKHGNTEPGDGIRYRGRGLVQLTWKNNYAAMGRLLRLPLVDKPDLAMTAPVAVKIMFEGMIRGLFTGKKLSDYFSAAKDDSHNARRIINGTDQASAISNIYRDFLRAVTAAEDDETSTGAIETRRYGPDEVVHIPRPASTEPEPPHGEQSGRIEALQKKLAWFGYVEVGGADGKWGGMTAGAIAAYKNDRRLSGPAILDEALERDMIEAELQQWKRPVAEERKNADASKVAERSEVIPAAQTNKAVSAIGAIVSSIGAAFAGIGSVFQDLWNSDAVTAVREFGSDNVGLIFAGVAGVALFMFWQSRKAERAEIENFREGKLR